MLHRLLIAALLATAFAGPARAWDDHGHMMVAAIAYDRLEPKNPCPCRRAAGAEPVYPVNGTNDAPSALAAKARFMQAATAPDAIKGNPAFQDDGNAPPATPDAARNIGFDDTLTHKYWHYRDIPFSTDGTKLRPMPAVERAGSASPCSARPWPPMRRTR